MYIPLPKLTPDGYRVLVLYISDEAKNSEAVPFSHFLKATFMSIDILAKLDSPTGIILVHDGKNMTMPFVAAAATEIPKLVLLGTVRMTFRFKNMKIIHVRRLQLFHCNAIKILSNIFTEKYTGTLSEYLFL